MALKRNVAANYFGGIWSAVIGLIFVPIYIKFMGVEAYGLVGIFTTLQMMFSILDLGLSSTLSREMARLNAEEGKAQTMADTVRTFEIIYWLVAALVILFVALLSQFISQTWLNPEELSRDEVKSALYVMAFALGLRWPSAIYVGGLIGLQRQVRTNVVGSILGTIQAVGAVLVLWLYEPTINVFFAWQAGMSLLQVLVLRLVLWDVMPIKRGATFSKSVIADVWRFAAGMSGLAIVTTILTQMDKIILSKMLPLKEFGYYTFASTVAMALVKLIAPVFTAYYPRLTELVAQKKPDLLAKTYHQGCQLISILVLPSAFTLAVFSKEIINIWTGDAIMAENTYIIIGFLAIGNAFNALMNIPYALQLAHGWTRLTFYGNLVAVILLGPSLYFAAQHWGAEGAASIWVVLNVGYIVINIPLMHRRILKNEKWSWYKEDFFKPAIIILAIVLLSRTLDITNLPKLAQAAFVFCTFVLATLSAVYYSNSLSPYLRSFWIKYVCRRGAC